MKTEDSFEVLLTLSSLPGAGWMMAMMATSWDIFFSVLIDPVATA